MIHCPFALVRDRQRGEKRTKDVTLNAWPRVQRHGGLNSKWENEWVICWDGDNEGIKRITVVALIN